MAQETPESISSRATGALFFAAGGSVWLCAGLALTLHLPLAIALVAILLLTLVLPAVRILRRTSRAPHAAANSERDRGVQRAFNWINTIQWLLAGAAVTLLNVNHQQVFIAPAIAFIVGAHLLPLARLFRYAAHYVTGSLLVLWALGLMVWIPRDDLPRVCSLGAAAILLTSAAYTLTLSWHAANRLRKFEPSALN